MQKGDKVSYQLANTQRLTFKLQITAPLRITGRQSKAQVLCQHFLLRMSILEHRDSKTKYVMSPLPQ